MEEKVYNCTNFIAFVPRKEDSGGDRRQRFYVLGGRFSVRYSDS